jgi:hypothetical protein
VFDKRVADEQSEIDLILQIDSWTTKNSMISRGNA